MGIAREQTSRRRRGSAFSLAVLLPSAAALLLVLAACGSPEPTATPTSEPTPTTTTAPPPPQEPTPTPTPSKEAWEIEWDEVVAGAKEEGELLIVGGSAAIMYRPVFDRFGEIFDVEVKSSGGSSARIVDRILAERKAGLHTVDHFLAGDGTIRDRLIPAGVLAPIEPVLILPEVTDTSNWYDGHLWFADAEKKYVIRYAGDVQFGVEFRYNTDLVSSEEFIAFSSMWDILEPQWVGTIVAQPPTTTGTGLYSSVYWDPALGTPWLERFFNDMDVTFVLDKKLLTDGVAQGKYAFCFACGGAWHEIDKLRELGAPVASSLDRRDWAEGAQLGMSGSDGMMSIFDKAPHQNAATAFVNWWLSKEGQTAVHTLTTDRLPPPTLREDVTEWGNTLEMERRIPGQVYFRIADIPGYDEVFGNEEVKRLFNESRK